MMFKKYILILLAFFITTCSLGVNTKAKEDCLNVLIVYDTKVEFSYNRNILNSISELMGAFNTKVETVDIKEYKKNYLESYDYVFSVIIDKDISNEEFIYDIKKFDKTICWIGNGIEKLVDHNENYNISFTPKTVDLKEIYYFSNGENDKTLKKFTIDKYGEINVLDNINEEIIIHSYFSDGRQQYPYVVNEKNLWYVSLIPSENVLFFIFSDILNEVFNVKNISEQKIFIRIEDVHPFRDTYELRKIADYLYDENIPFIVALIPAYIDTKTGYENYITDKPEFINTIKYMQDKGGTIILHGYNHGNFKDKEGGEDYEFWNGIKDSPVTWDIEEYVTKNLSKAVIDCVKNGIYPLGFEAPHYGIDSRGYSSIKKHFSTYVGAYQSSDKQFTTTSYPYILRNTKNFNCLIPENLGYIDNEDILWKDKLKENYDILNLVRGHTGGMFFHPYLDIEYLKESVEFLKSKNVSFLDLKKYDNWIEFNDITIKSKDGNISIENRFKEGSLDEEHNNKYVEKINKILAIIVGIFCIIFFIIYLYFRNINKKKFLR